ncbi:MAG: restriction endonuclease [Pyrinomonadaceae bacterium]|nr:restriction endonuclease [Pyrinomonadaceae bacterium]
MAIPDYQSIMLPLLQLAATNPDKDFALREAVSLLAGIFKLTDEELQKLLPSGKQATFVNRVGWASTYLKKAGLLESTKRGYFKLAERGANVLTQNPTAINVRHLKQFPEFIEFQAARAAQEDGARVDSDATDSLTPEESLEIEYQKIRENLASQLLDRIKQSTPNFFERLVVELLVKMGYGGSRSDAGRAVGRSSDGGIDGIIKEDKLGLDVIYIQAKRWDENTVGRPDVQQFAGALQGQRASKGIFLTTSKFTSEAQEYVSRIGSKIVLINGEQLAQLMIDHNVGVSVSTTYEIKRIDSDYFSEEI